MNTEVFSDEEVARWQERAARVEILRDRWGIAHIYGETDADTVFGTLYAQAEDDFNRVETNYINAMGRLAEAEGAGEIYRDLRMRLFIRQGEMEELYESSPDWLKQLMDAFADGLNYYLYTHPEVTPRVFRRFEPWMALTFTEGSIGGDIERVNIARLRDFYGPGDMIAMTDDLVVDMEPRGSNGFSIAPSNSATGNALFLINPHTSFFFRSELHMVSEEGLNAYGAVTWGQFFIYQGFNENTGWMHTSSRADAIDEYLETIVERDDGYYYVYGDEERRLQESQVEIDYRDGDSMSTREFTVYHSHHGPIIREQDGRWVAISLMEEPVRALTQSYLRTKSRNYMEFNASMELLTNSSNNTVYADSDGNIAYYHGNFIPRRDPSFDWNAPLDGSNPATDWQGLHPLDDLITVLNPPNGWIQNTNNTPFSAAGEYSPREEDYPAYMANNPENPRGVHAVRVLEGRTDFTLDSLIEAAYDSLLTAFEPLIPALLAAAEEAPADDLEEQLALLADWDYRFGVDSVETTLAVYWAQTLMDSVNAEAGAAGINIYQYMAANASAEQKLDALRDASAELQSDWGSWQAAWGEVNRYQRINGDIVQQFNDEEESWPVGFASGRWGALASFGSRKYPGTRRMYGTSGNSFVAAVEFGSPLRARAITVGGLQSDPQSPHFDDQAEMYASGEFRDVLFYRDDIETNLERQYRPGE
ncbi:MAG: penicillin acylase family protein [Gammaproteobacteria bacterium]|nr:penicillin acylase family protein [Gammaproteobacteria bacterium]MDE0509549.1 penicillin acylase family protein [Gammaproteobacteria bacterium]MYA36452.1 acylase [Gammaproteobacteria bacterium]MYH85924.1 acylase [Gammaproteobacteria bacterium]MYK05896.1 acylase [Gammaproteobacteria bacterium]